MSGIGRAMYSRVGSKLFFTGLLALLAVLCAILVLSPGRTFASGTVYYVDSASGSDTNNGTSEGTPWKTLSKVNSVTFVAGDKLLFKAGGSWSGMLRPHGSGTGANRNVIGKYGTGPAPIIAANGATMNAVYLYNVEYWTVQDLEITNTAASVAQRNGVMIEGNGVGRLHGIYLQNLDIHDIRASRTVRRHPACMTIRGFM